MKCRRNMIMTRSFPSQLSTAAMLDGATLVREGSINDTTGIKLCTFLDEHKTFYLEFLTNKTANTENALQVGDNTSKVTTLNYQESGVDINQMAPPLVASRTVGYISAHRAHLIAFHVRDDGVLYYTPVMPGCTILGSAWHGVGSIDLFTSHGMVVTDEIHIYHSLSTMSSSVRIWEMSR